MALNIPIQKDKIPFLDRQGVKYAVVEDYVPTPELADVSRIHLEITTQNITDYGMAMYKAGVSQNLFSLGITEAYKVDKLEAKNNLKSV